MVQIMAPSQQEPPHESGDGAGEDHRRQHLSREPCSKFCTSLRRRGDSTPTPPTAAMEEVTVTTGIDWDVIRRTVEQVQAAADSPMMRRALGIYEQRQREVEMLGEWARAHERDLAFLAGVTPSVFDASFRRPRRASPPSPKEVETPKKREPIRVPDNPFWGGDYSA